MNDTQGERVSKLMAARRQQEALATVLLNKPVGYVSGQAEDGYPPAVVLVRPENQREGDRPRFRPGILKGLAPAGRTTSGMIALQDWRIER